MVGIVVGLLAAGWPARAQNPKVARASAVPIATNANAHSARPKKPNKPRIAAISATAIPAATDQTATVSRRKGLPRAKADRSSEAANAAIPDAERRAIQSALAWLGDYEGAATGDLDEKTIAAIKIFQKRNNGKESGVLNDEQRALLAAAVKAPQTAVGWRVIDDPATGARLGLPSKLISQTGSARTGNRWTSGRGQIQIETFRLPEAALPALFNDERKTPRQRSVAYSALKPDSFVISGEQGLKKFVVRAEASGTELRGVTILYDQATAGIMDRVAVAMADGFHGFPDPNDGPPPGYKRSVEYGTAIVATSRGDLMALRQATDECQAITVPGFGHAARIAVDKTSDLALLRLYGARNLVPAPLAGGNGKGDDLTLFGVADPLAQAGGGAVTSAVAHLTPQGVEPAPKLGFSGAAAIDAQGRFAGVVELQSAVVAGTGPVSQQATLVPADAVRAFLQAQGITPVAGRTTIDQSIVRVICVRK